MLIVTNGLANVPDGLQLHPLLSPLQQQLAGRAKRWFRAPLHTPLSLFAWLMERSPASLVAARLDLPKEARQCWLASPFHARLMRDHLQVMPEGLFSWTADDAAALVSLLNPLLKDEGMTLHAIGAAMLLACHDPLDAAPASFAEISGRLLPNRHPEGTDGGRLMRLVAEIQMFLHNHRDALKSTAKDVSGLWFWSGASLPLEAPLDSPSVATRNPFLAAVTESRGAKLTITDAEQLEESINPSAPLPRDVILFGGGYAVWLTPSFAATIAAKLRKVSATFDPNGVQEETALLQQLRTKL